MNCDTSTVENSPPGEVIRESWRHEQRARPHSRHRFTGIIRIALVQVGHALLIPIERPNRLAQSS